jgi:hypothetical protein
VAAFRPTSQRPTASCTVFKVGPRHGLTAAHCFELSDGAGGYVVNATASTVRLVFGQYGMLTPHRDRALERAQEARCDRYIELLGTMHVQTHDGLAQLHEQRRIFTQCKDARLLIWQAADEEHALINAFIAKECEAESADTPDIFLQLSTPFRSDSGHGHALTTELHTLYEEASQLRVADQSVTWRSLPSGRSTDDIEAFVSVLLSLRSHLVAADGPSTIAVWLLPNEVGSWGAYLLWLHRLVQKLLPNIRVLVVDHREAPQYAPLAKADPLRVREKACDLSVLAAIEELATTAGTDTPGGAYRALQAACAARLAEGDLDGAVRAATSASELAKEQGWPHLAAVTSMMLAAAYGAQKKPNEALAAYAEAELLGVAREAQESASTDEPAFGTRIRLQARLGQGAVLLSCGAYKYAAVAYEQSAVLAHQLADAPTELDACRLASLSHSELGDASAAWELGSRGFQLGIGMDEETRRSSTLPYLAEHLLRLTDRHGAYSAHRRPLEAHLTKLLGAAWRDELVKAG